MNYKFLAIIFLLFQSFNSMALTIENRFENPELENKAKEIFKEIRCVTCDGESIYDSKADIAKSMRELIRDEIRDDKTRQEIIDSFVKSYGAEILMQPPFNKSTFILWFFPLILAIISIIFLLKFFRSKSYRNG